MDSINLKSFQEFHTENLILRKLKNEDKEEIFAIRSNSEIAKYIDRPIYNFIDEAIAFIKKINSGIENNNWFYWGITKKDSDKIIGTICIWQISIEESQAEIGFELLPSYQRKGIMFEAVKPIIDFAFNENNFKRLLGEVAPENFNSIKLMKKYGFKLNLELSPSENSPTVFYELKNPKKTILTNLYQL